MGVDIESLFTSALGLQAPWSVKKVELDTTRRRIDFELKLKHLPSNPLLPALPKSNPLIHRCL